MSRTRLALVVFVCGICCMSSYCQVLLSGLFVSCHFMPAGRFHGYEFLMRVSPFCSTWRREKRTPVFVGDAAEHDCIVFFFVWRSTNRFKLDLWGLHYSLALAQLLPISACLLFLSLLLRVSLFFVASLLRQQVLMYLVAACLPRKADALA